MVLAVVFCALAGGDKAAVELGMCSDMDLIAVVAGIEAALFANAPVVGIQLALAVMAVDAYAAVTGADLGAAVLLPALVGGGVLYAFDGEVLYIGLNAFAGNLGASESGVAAALEDGLAVFVADVAVAVAFACAMAVAVSGLAAGTDAYVRCAVISCGRADIPTAALMAALFVLTEGGRLQQDAVVGGQQGAAGALNVRTGHGDVRCLSCSGSVQAGFAAGIPESMRPMVAEYDDWAAEQGTDSIVPVRYHTNVFGSASNGYAFGGELRTEAMWFRSSIFDVLGVKPAHCFCTRVKGDSMYPTLTDRGTVLWQMTSRYTGEGIYLFRQVDELRIKRLQQINGHTFRIISDNANKDIYPTTDLDLREMQDYEFEVYGRYLWDCSIKP